MQVNTQISLSTIDMQKEEKRIMKAGTYAFLSFLTAGVIGYYLLPVYFIFPEALAERLAFASIASFFVFVWVLYAIGVVSYKRRKSPADILGSAYAPPSPVIAIPVAFLQNTLEQATLLSIVFFAFVAIVEGALLSAIPVAVLAFAIGRALFLRGYAGGAGSRAFGMSLTMMPAILGSLVIFVKVSLWLLL